MRIDIELNYFTTIKFIKINYKIILNKLHKIRIITKMNIVQFLIF